MGKSNEPSLTSLPLPLLRLLPSMMASCVTPFIGMLVMGLLPGTPANKWTKVCSRSGGGKGNEKPTRRVPPSRFELTKVFLFSHCVVVGRIPCTPARFPFRSIVPSVLILPVSLPYGSDDRSFCAFVVLGLVVAAFQRCWTNEEDHMFFDHFHRLLCWCKSPFFELLLQLHDGADLSFAQNRT